MNRDRRFRACLTGFLVMVVGSTTVIGADAEPAAAASPFRQAVDAVQKSARAHPDRSPGYFDALERGFRDLQSRFPAEAEVYAELLFVADHTDGTRSEELLKSILAWPAPKTVQAKACGVLEKKRGIDRVFDRQWTSIDGTPIRFSDLRGKVVLVDFWASWCAPCREKLPEIKALYANFRDKGFEIIGVSFDDDLGKLRRFLASEGMTWPQVADGQGWEGPRAAEFGVTSLPTLWLIDRKGRLRDVDARERLATSLQRLLAEPGL